MTVRHANRHRLERVARWTRYAGLLSAIVAGTGAAQAPVPSARSCPPMETSVEALRTLKAREWSANVVPHPDSLALALVACLDNPNPELRDDLAFEALSTLLRRGALGARTLQAIAEELVPRLSAGAPDVDGFRKPFAALALSEVARADRLSPSLPPALHRRLIDAAVTYLSGVRDYRGFDEREGWRHGVAHGADFLLQLSLDRRLERADHQRVVAAVAMQAGGRDSHFYIYGEGRRLARPVLVVAAAGTLDAAAWKSWCAAATTAAPAADWNAAAATQAGLARINNLRAFFLSLYLGVSEEPESSSVRALMPCVREALSVLP